MIRVPEFHFWYLIDRCLKIQVPVLYLIDFCLVPDSLALVPEKQVPEKTVTSSVL